MRSVPFIRGNSFWFTLIVLLLLGYAGAACKTKAQNEVKEQAAHEPVASAPGMQKQAGKTNLTGLNSNGNHLTSPANGALKRQVRIIIPDWYRRAEYPVFFPEDQWQELYYDRSAKRWKTAITSLKVRMAYEACSADSAMVIETGHDATLLFTGLTGVPRVVSTITSQELLFPGHDLAFVMNGVQYRLIANSKVFNDKGKLLTREELGQKDQEDLRDELKQFDYRLQLVRGNENPMDLFHMDSLEFTNPTLIWMGDLNNDGLPDMLLDMPQFTESSKYYLYLSDSKDEAMPIKFAAEIFIQRDC